MAAGALTTTGPVRDAGAPVAAGAVTHPRAADPPAVITKVSTATIARNLFIKSLLEFH